ncbi:MAG: hypothetical protein P9M15_03510 [Candidatus Electryoneaceae bacterium]|nr:hypothetical protein [Candidatus Electryoneaceae bacterium]
MNQIQDIRFRHSFSTHFFVVLLVWVLVFGIGQKVWSQTIKTDVTFHIAQLSSEEQVYLQGLAQELTHLINNYPWVDRTYRYDLPIQIDISLTGHLAAQGIIAMERDYGGNSLRGSKCATEDGIPFFPRRPSTFRSAVRSIDRIH